MGKSSIKRHIRNFILHFGAKNMSAVETVMWFTQMGMNNKQANASAKQVL